MAEARFEEEEGPREFREPAVLRNRRGQSNPATDRSERNKPERRLSQGPLSSIRAAIKRTSTRSSSQGDHARERRRPEITILSAEPLAANAWFPGASGGFPPTPPPAQPIWGGNIPAAAQPPPSYDQVIKEKTQEQVPPPATARRHSTTIATQTDFLLKAGPEYTATPHATEREGSAARRPLKPPRPSLPKPKPESDVTAVLADQPCQIPPVPTHTSSATNQQAAEAQPSLPDLSCATQSDPSQPLPTLPDELTNPLDSCRVSVDSPSQPSAADPASQTLRPIPLPRSKPNLQSIGREVKVQTLVRIKDDGERPQISLSQGGLPSGKYLQELLDIFCADDQCYQVDPSDQTDPSDRTDPSNQTDPSNRTDPSDDSEQNEEGDSMSVSHKIHAFEKQAAIDAADEAPLVKPEPRPRTQYPKPPAVAAKPSFTRRPSGLWEQINASGSPTPPTPAPRPLLAKSSSEADIWDTPPTQVAKVPLLPPSRPSIMTRAKSLAGPEVGPVYTLPMPPPKIKPVPDTLSYTNHAPPLPPSKPGMENGNGSVDRPVGPTPIKPQRLTNFAPNPLSISRKPTMIRVPSKVYENESQEHPPPLPVQKPFGGVALPIIRRPTHISRPNYPPPPVEASNPEGFSPSMPELSLPPRPVGGKVLPPRPPPAKTAPGRPAPPGTEGLHGPSSQAGWGATLPMRSQSSKVAVKKGPVQPPRPNPGHPLYNKYTLEIPHAIAEFDYNGSNTAELSFQKNEVLVLREQIDSNTFECQVGDVKGPVQKSHLKVITPLSSAPSRPSPQVPPLAQARRGSSGIQVQALHDFIPEGPEDLALKAGDLVSMVEQVDDEWYRGTNRGATGIFPVSYVRVLFTIPAPPSGQKAPPVPASVSGPRCVARFDFEGDHSNELSFSDGDVIRLREYVGQEWARGELNGYVGMFPLNFVEIVEDLPAPPPTATATATPMATPTATPTQHNMQMKIPLPGMVAVSKNHESARPSQFQPAPSGAEWGRAQYDFTAETGEDLSFQQGAVILITEHVDAEWCRGRLDGREGCFPAAFVEPCPAPPEGTESPRSGGGGRARALFDFVPESEDELSLKAGDIMTGVESVDDEWFLGELKGMRGLVPKNYVQVLP